MSANRKVFMTALVTFTGGFVAGMIYSSRSGQAFRRTVADRARTGTGRLYEHLHQIEHKLEQIEERLETQVRSAMPAREEQANWDIDSDDVASDLQRIPRQ